MNKLGEYLLQARELLVDERNAKVLRTLEKAQQLSPTPAQNEEIKALAGKAILATVQARHMKLSQFCTFYESSQIVALGLASSSARAIALEVVANTFEPGDKKTPERVLKIFATKHAAAAFVQRLCNNEIQKEIQRCNGL